MSELMDKADFDAIDDRKFQEIETGWGKKVRLRSLTADEFQRCEEFVFEQTQKQKLANLHLCALGQMICDAEGKPIFKTIPEGESAMGKRNPKLLHKVLEAARKLTPMSQYDYRDIEPEVEEIAGNSETPLADSPTN